MLGAYSQSQSQSQSESQVQSPAGSGPVGLGMVGSVGSVGSVSRVSPSLGHLGGIPVPSSAPATPIAGGITTVIQVGGGSTPRSSPADRENAMR